MKTMDNYMLIPKKFSTDHDDDDENKEREREEDILLGSSVKEELGRDTTTQQYSHLLSQCQTLSPANSVDSYNSRGSKAGSIVSATRRKRERIRSSPPASIESLNLPSLQVLPSQNDATNDEYEQRRKSIVDELLHVASEDGRELEVCLRHVDSKVLQESSSLFGRKNKEFQMKPKNNANNTRYQVKSDGLGASYKKETSLKSQHEHHSEEEKKSETSPTWSPLELRAKEIMEQSKLSSLELGGAPPTEDDLSKTLIQEALDRAAARSKAAAAEALHTGSAIIQQSGDAPDPVMDARNNINIHPQFPSRTEGQDTASNNLGSTVGTAPCGTESVLSPKIQQRDIDSKLNNCTSPTESMSSIDDFEKAVNRLPSRFVTSGSVPQEKILRRLDGVISPVSTSSPVVQASRNQPPLSTHFEEDENSNHSENNRCTKSVSYIKPVVIKSFDEEDENPSGGWFDYFWGSTKEESYKDDDAGNSMMPMNCGPSPEFIKDELPTVSKSLVHVLTDTDPVLPSYADALEEQTADIRMPEWIDSQFYAREELPCDGTYQLGESRTVIVHEIIRGSWTWATAWSPDGNSLAVATDNHHLAVIDTASSSVWRVRHDKKVTAPARPGSTHSIRSIAWGNHFIAIGGTGNAVSILSPTEPYPILHTITPTGFVGSLHWLPGANTLLIGSRLGQALIAKIHVEDQPSDDPSSSVQSVQSTIVHSIDRQRTWVNAAKFSPGGTALAVGDSTGILGVYQYDDQSTSPLTNLANFKLQDSILDVEWSPDGKWLYAGGEDYAITIISTEGWEAVHRIKRDRWVHFLSSSNGGTHVAIGGVASEVSILDVNRGWDPAINVSLKGLVPLSAQWHPRDQYLVLTGQNNSIMAVETTNARYVSGHFLRSASPISSISFSPDGRLAAIGNEAGIVTIFKLSGTTFISVYEMVIDCASRLSICWSPNGAFVAISVENKVVIVSRTKKHPSAPPNASGFSVAKVVRNLGTLHDVAIDPKSRFVAVSGRRTRILDSTLDFKCVLEIENAGTSLANSFSPDGKWFATVGRSQQLVVYDTSPRNLSSWQAVLAVQTQVPALALAWSPVMVGGLHYLAYGGEDKAVHIMEIRTKERTWETVINIQRDDIVHDLDWNSNGLVAAGIGNGTVSIFDLSYLQSGWAVNEMDYNWQRQALTCVTEIRRNRGKQCMRCVRWIPSAPGSDTLLAVGGTDGEVEIVDLTERQKCSGFSKVAPKL